MGGVMRNLVSVYSTGLKNSWAQQKMLFFLYGINLLFAYLVSLPFTGMVEQALDQTVMADKLLQAFDFTALAILIQEYGRGVSLSWNIFVFAACYGLLHTFFSGGIIKIFCSNMNFTFRDFWTGCVEYFSRFFKLLLISLGVLLVILVLYLLFSGLLDMITENTSTEFWPFVLFGLKLVMLAALLAWISMLSDYTKIIIVRHDIKSIVQALIQSFKFIRNNFIRTSVIYLGLLIMGAGFLVIYLGLEQLITTSTIAGIFIFFILSQFYIISRIWWRINYYYVQGTYYLSTAK
jgi:hypothetical protein